MGTENQGRLDAFGIESNDAPPRAQKEHKVTATNSNQTAGWVGPSPNRDVYIFAKVCERGKHRLRELEAYALSDTVLSKVASYGAQRIFVIELDTGDVLEWPARDFDRSVPKKYLQDDDDPQTCAIDAHAKVWTNHEDRFWMNESIDVSDGYRKDRSWWPR